MAEKPASPHLFADVLARVHAICAALATEGNWPAGIDFSRVVVEPPRDASHGDMATNAAMVLAKEAKAKPRDLADRIAEKLRADDLIASVDVAGPGFINLTLKPSAWADALRTVLREGDASYGRSAIGSGRKGQRRICLGQSDRADACRPLPRRGVRRCAGSLLHFAGYDVTREYYINDAGAQVDVLARSAFLRYREALGEDIGAIPEGLYPGDYLKPVGQALAAEHGDKLLAMPEGAMAADRARQGHRHDDGRDQGRSRRAQHQARRLLLRALADRGRQQQVAETIDFLRAKGDVYEGRLPPPKGAPVED